MTLCMNPHTHLSKSAIRFMIAIFSGSSQRHELSPYASRASSGLSTHCPIKQSLTQQTKYKLSTIATASRIQVTRTFYAAAAARRFIYRSGHVYIPYAVRVPFRDGGNWSDIFTAPDTYVCDDCESQKLPASQDGSAPQHLVHHPLLRLRNSIEDTETPSTEARLATLEKRLSDLDAKVEARLSALDAKVDQRFAALEIMLHQIVAGLSRV